MSDCGILFLFFGSFKHWVFFYHFCIHHLYILNVIIMIIITMISTMMLIMTIPSWRWRSKTSTLAFASIQARWYHLINCSQPKSTTIYYLKCNSCGHLTSSHTLAVLLLLFFFNLCHYCSIDNLSDLLLQHTNSVITYDFPELTDLCVYFHDTTPPRAPPWLP